MYYVDEGGVFSHDELCISGARTLSLTLRDAPRAVLFYEPFIEVKNAKGIILGLTARAVTVCSFVLALDFYNQFFQKLNTVEEDIAKSVNHSFNRLYRLFEVPKDAVYFRPLFISGGRTTALTFFYPFAYLKLR